MRELMMPPIEIMLTILPPLLSSSRQHPVYQIEGALKCTFMAAS
jgi:hypothetical protein